MRVTNDGICRYLRMRINACQQLRRIDPDGSLEAYRRHGDRIETLTQALQIVEGLAV